MGVVSVRVPPEIKREMERLRGKINWSEEIREFIRLKIEEVRRRELLEDLVNVLEDLPEAPVGTAERLVREDRDGH